MSESLLTRVEAGAALESAEAEALMEEVLGGRLDTPAIVRLLMALNARPYRATELAAFARVMRRHAARVFAEGEVPPTNMVDTCGTGGDGTQTFNISTAAAIVAAAAGARVAKHGNRAASSLSGSADVLEALGVRIDLPFLEVGKAIREIGIGFLFAQAAHTATRHAMPARKQIGVRTIFNLLGPLTNPAGAQAQGIPWLPAQSVLTFFETPGRLGLEKPSGIKIKDSPLGRIFAGTPYLSPNNSDRRRRVQTKGYNLLPFLRSINLSGNTPLRECCAREITGCPDRRIS